MTKRKEYEDFKEKYLLNRPYDDENLKDWIEVFTTYKNELGEDVFPVVDDLLFYLEVKHVIANRKPTQLEREFLKVAERRMDQMKYNELFKDNMEEAERQFDEKMNPTNETAIPEVETIYIEKKKDKLTENLGELF